MPCSRRAWRQLEQALECDAEVADAGRTPVILVHGTGATPQENWSGGCARALPRVGFPVRTAQLPERALVDLRVSAEYVVHAFREVSRLSGHKVSLVGHGQGGLHPVWALRFWPAWPTRSRTQSAWPPRTAGRCTRTWNVVTCAPLDRLITSRWLSTPSGSNWSWTS